MGDISGLINLFEEEKLLDQPELYKKITEGTGDFTFRDMYEQFQNLLKLGPLGKIMSMIPGFGNALGPNQEKASVDRIKTFMTIMDSFTQQELDSDNTIFNKQPQRAVRIARGAGVPIRAVHEILETFKPFKKVAEKMKDMTKGGGMKNMEQMMKGGGRNANANMKQIASMFNPQMIQRMGGMGNLQQMMKNFAGGGKHATDIYS
jgi:signal recognition particle subunit SRP54